MNMREGAEEHSTPSAEGRPPQDAPAETVDALERKILGTHPEDVRRAHDETEHTDAAEHDQDIETTDLPGVAGRDAPPAEPPV
jgi:hypothetical protein